MNTRSKTDGAEFEGPHKSTSYHVESVDNEWVKIAPVGSSSGPLKLATTLFPIRPRSGHVVKLNIAVTDPITPKEWARAFALQGASDLKVYEILSQARVESCHRLHYLQMATEKIAKAFRVGAGKLPPRRKSHVAAAEFVKLYYHHGSMRTKYGGKHEQLTIVRDQMVIVASQIEKLAPAVDEEAVPENVEYPWATSVKLEVPCQHRFPIEDLPEWQLNQFVQMLKDVVAEMTPHS